MARKFSVIVSEARSKEQEENMKRIIKDKVDPFEWSVFQTYHREPVLRKGRYWLVTPNDFPYAGTKLHLLLVYKDAVKLPSETHPKAWQELQRHLSWIEKTYKIKGGSLVMRFGEAPYTGASVDHLHLHVIVGAKRKNAHTKKLRTVVGYEVETKKKRRVR